ncbi:AAA ATPase domain-containing protein [Amycolatopsis xylanica]|uniref:AAA ATPase domain-containing protein n=1 Tax=Amycolatopsis xylanica TaxID=589385 RepID=A0A1H3D4V1_9PSEU|nr:LuxR family transcriptional regulator [Amycolatopsis xylanica]SDX60689.1 AAA ATPase domain-containing protein [Amycolatopsis xylanica]
MVSSAALPEAARPAAFVVVEGEPGAGRSALLADFAGRAGREHVVLSARCTRLRRPVPLGPLLEAVIAFGGNWNPVSAKLSPLTGALRPSLPELAGILPSWNGETPTRHQIFRALRELLTLHDRTLLVLDDVHEADEETQDFLRFLAGGMSPRLTVVVSSVSRLPHSGATARVVLSPWGIDEIAALTGSREVAKHIRERTGGVAGAVMAMLKTGDDLPTAWCDALTARMEGTEGAPIAEAAAVLGGPACAAALAAVSGVAATEQAITAALAAGLLLDHGRGRYVSRSPLVSDALYEAISGPRRCVLHTRAADFLAAATEPAADRVAHHFRQAGALDDWVRWTSDAVDRAADDGRPDETMRLLEAALEDPELPRAACEVFAVRLSRELALGLAHERTVRLLRRTIRDCPLTRSARGEIRINLGRVLVNQTGQVDAGRDEIELAAADLAHRPALLARGLATLALPHVGAVPVEQNLRWLDQAEQVSKRVQDVEVLLAVSANRVSSRMQVADPGAWDAIGTLPRAPQSAEVRWQLSRTYINLADAAAWNGHYPVARAYLATAKRLISDENQPYLEALATGTELRVDVETGAWSEVDGQARRLVEQVGATSSLAAEPLLVLGWHDFGQGRRAPALRNFDAACALAAGSAPIQASAFAGRVAVHLAGKDLAVACRLADQGIASVRRKNNWVWAAELVPLAIRVLLAQERTADATALLAEYRHGVDDRDAPLAHAAALFAEGLLAHAAADLATAAGLLSRASRAYRELPRPSAAANADELAGECFAALGDHQRARAALTAAESGYRALAAAADAQRCRRTLVRYDPTTPRRGRRGYGSELSPREIEVVELAAQSLTNREIAARLFLSARTVEVHLGRALHKLGLPSRTMLSQELLRKHLSTRPMTA